MDANAKQVDDSGISSHKKQPQNQYYRHSHHDDSTTSNLSAFLSDISHLESSSSSLSSSSSGYQRGSDFSFDQKSEASLEADYMQVSPFPRVKTCMIAQIKQLDSNAVSANNSEPIYENLTSSSSIVLKKAPAKVPAQQIRKQYSINDIMHSLKSLEMPLSAQTKVSRKLRAVDAQDDDLLCDKEVQFYLNRVEHTSNLSEQHQYQFHEATPMVSQQKPTFQAGAKPKMTVRNSTSAHFNSINRPVALWEQLV